MYVGVCVWSGGRWVLLPTYLPTYRPFRDVSFLLCSLFFSVRCLFFMWLLLSSLLYSVLLCSVRLSPVWVGGGLVMTQETCSARWAGLPEDDVTMSLGRVALLSP